jgi:cytochrome c-type biogenesis protein CcmH
MTDDAMLPLPRCAGEGARRADGGDRSDCPHPPSAPSPARGGRERICLRIALVLLVGLLCASTAHAIDPLPFKDRAQEVRFQDLTKQLRCLVCQNQDLADSDADLARDLRKQVFDMMQSGKSDADIKQYLVARYNDFVLYDPPLKPGTWLLWFAPMALVIAGAFVVAGILRRRARLPLSAVESGKIDPEEDW